MTFKHSVSIIALAASCAWAVPANAQDSDAAIRDELAAMRAQMAEMAARMETLQSKLDQAEAKASAAEAASANAVTVATAAKEAEPATKVSWKGAPEIEGKGGWSFKPRGRMQYDAGFVDAPASTGRPDGFGSEARRLRLGVEGDIPGGFGYKFEADFAGGGAEIVDAILTYEDKGLTLTDAFGFERRVGISAQYATGPVLLQGGVFTDNIDDLPNKSYSVDGRAVFMPKLGATQLHLAGSAHYADLQDAATTVRYRQRPLVHFTGQRFIDTGALSAASETGYGLEAAGIRGPFHFAAEGFWQSVSRPGLADPTFFGGYAEIGMFLTGGDTRGYKGGVFDRVKPKKEVGEGGIGAIELNLRYDYLDLVDAGIAGGKQDGYLLSLIWTPTDYTRLLFNYGRLGYTDAVYPAAGGDRDYSVDTFGVRAQVDF